MEELYWASIKTNISNVFFDDEKDDGKFIRFINKQLDSNEWIVNSLAFDCPIAGINSINVAVLELTSNHILDTEILVDSEFDYDTLRSMDDLYDYIENTVIPEFIEAFNTNCQINFPTTRSDDFNWLKFDGDNFYTKVYLSESSGTYMNVSVKPNVLYAIPDFEVQA